MSVCWNCRKPAGGNLFCQSCGALQQPPSDFYALMGLEPKLSFSADPLQRRFYELSRQLHPDRFMRKTERERQYSLDASSTLNDAYRTLRDPVQRAEYFLKRNGFNIGEQRSKDVPAELLEEVFELNMALEEMKAGDASARPQLQHACQNFNRLLSQVDSDLDNLYAKYDMNPAPETLTHIRGVLNRRKYIQNLVSEVTGVLGT